MSPFVTSFTLQVVMQVSGRHKTVREYDEGGSNNSIEIKWPVCYDCKHLNII